MRFAALVQKHPGLLAGVIQLRDSVVSQLRDTTVHVAGHSTDLRLNLDSLYQGRSNAPVLLRRGSLTAEVSQLPGRPRRLLIRCQESAHTVQLQQRTIQHFQTQQKTLVLDNARSRRLLEQARSETGIARAELAAAKRENGKLVGLAYPRWYQITWFWVALVLVLLLLGSVALRFLTFTPLSFFR